MTRNVGTRWWMAALLVSLTAPVFAQNVVRTSASTQQHVPQLSEATAWLESSVREMYQGIEPGNDTSPNELLAYADLRALRLYTNALEVAGWSLEKSAEEYQKYQRSGAYSTARGLRITDPKAEIALERFRAYREATRTLLFRVRSTAVSVEHQVSFCPPEVSKEWRQNVLPYLRDAIAATEPLFAEEFVHHNYSAPTRPGTPTVPVSNPSVPAGMPRNAVDISKSPTFQPHDGDGRGQGRYVEVRAFGGPIRVKSIRFRSHENAFGLLGTSVLRDITVNQLVQPGDPVFIPCNRKRWADISDLQIEWENADRNRKAWGTIDVVENSPDEK